MPKALREREGGWMVICRALSASLRGLIPHPDAQDPGGKKEGGGGGNGGGSFAGLICIAVRTHPTH